MTLAPLRAGRFASPLALLLVSFAPHVEVPGDFDDLQTAIDSVPSGETIVVHGGTWESLVIDKPLTLIGDPSPTLVGAGGGFVLEPPLRLAGPGSGRLTLGNVSIGGTVDGFVFSSSAPGIAGGGFGEVLIFDSTVEAPEWVFLTGLGYGEPAIALDTDSVGTVFLERSTARASKTDVDDCVGAGSSAFDGLPGVVAPGATVVLLDSTVTGGTAGPFFGLMGCPPCPACAGPGGTGIVCETVIQSGSTVSGGAGAQWFDCFSGASCGSAPDGAPYDVVDFVLLLDDLQGSGPIAAGSSYGLTLLAPPPSAALLASSGSPISPIDLGGDGLLFLNPSELILVGTFPSPGAAAVSIPPSPAVVGVDVTFQAYSPSTGLSRPVDGAIVP